MTQLQTATRLEGPADRSSLPRQHSRLTSGGATALYPLLFKSLFGSHAADRHLADDLTQAITGVYQLKDRQPLPSRSGAASLHVLIEGWAFRSQMLLNGGRQITDISVPSDFCPTSPYDEGPSPEIEACGSARVAVLDMELLAERGRSLVEQRHRRQQADVVRRLRARLVSLGRRDARERMAYVMAETHARLASVDLAEDGAFAWPFTQDHLADILGLTPVHTNRVLARLRNENLLLVRSRQVVVLNMAGCVESADLGIFAINEPTPANAAAPTP